jgi:hypothetical protein
MKRSLCWGSVLVSMLSISGCAEDAKYPSCKSDDECNYQEDEVCRQNQCVKGQPKKIPPFSGAKQQRRLGRR